MVCLRLTVSLQYSLLSPVMLLLMGVTVSRVVPEGLTDKIILVCRVWTPSSLYWGRICVTSHWGSQIFQPGAALMTNPRGPPISCWFSTAIARWFLDRVLSHTSKLSTCKTSSLWFWQWWYYSILLTAITALISTFIDLTKVFAKVTTMHLAFLYRDYMYYKCWQLLVQ